VQLRYFHAARQLLDRRGLNSDLRGRDWWWEGQLGTSIDVQLFEQSELRLQSGIVEGAKVVFRIDGGSGYIWQAAEKVGTTDPSRPEGRSGRQK